MFSKNTQTDQEVSDILGMDKKEEPSQKETEFKTDVADVTADDVIKRGNDEYPVFDIDKRSFHQNMEGGRRRIRFPSGSKAQQYMQKSRYNRDFYVRYKDDTDGKEYVRKIK